MVSEINSGVNWKAGLAGEQRNIEAQEFHNFYTLQCLYEGQNRKQRWTNTEARMERDKFVQNAKIENLK